MPEGGLPDEVAPLLLAHLPPQRLLAKVHQLELVGDPAELDPQTVVLVSRVETVGNGDDPNVVELELMNDHQQEHVVPGQAREVIDQKNIDEALTHGAIQRLELRAVSDRTRHGRVLVDVVRQNGDAAASSFHLADPLLVLQALGALILRAEAGVDGSTQGRHQSSSPGSASERGRPGGSATYSRASSSAR